MDSSSTTICFYQVLIVVLVNAQIWADCVKLDRDLSSDACLYPQVSIHPNHTVHSCEYMNFLQVFWSTLMQRNTLHLTITGCVMPSILNTMLSLYLDFSWNVFYAFLSIYFFKTHQGQFMFGPVYWYGGAEEKTSARMLTSSHNVILHNILHLQTKTCNFYMKGASIGCLSLFQMK